MERSAIRDRDVNETAPDFASLHPGYASCAQRPRGHREDGRKVVELAKYPRDRSRHRRPRHRQAAAPASGSAHRPQRRKQVRAWTLPPNYLRSVGGGVVVDHGGPYVIPSPKANAPVEQVLLNPADIEELHGFEENSVGMVARRRFRMGSVERD